MIIKISDIEYRALILFSNLIMKNHNTRFALNAYSSDLLKTSYFFFNSYNQNFNVFFSRKARKFLVINFESFLKLKVILFFFVSFFSSSFK
jgi:hypothetical protein